jgi:alpha-L-fucosidase
MRRSFVCLLLITGAFTATVSAQPDENNLQRWKDLKYSMFIHYGIYSVLGGVWDDKPVARGLSEQIQAHAGIYSDTYAAVAKRFNPVRWNADSITLLAKAAGMRSIVITSKHHDGFSMFHTRHSGFNVVEATPFKRDVIRELSEACSRHGLKFGLYFSLIHWHYPQASPISSHNSDAVTPEHHDFNKKQVTELLTNYGQISELWFDMGSQSMAQSKEMRELVHRLQPNCLVSSRLGNDMGDFTVMGDNQEPDYSIGVPWQSPASFFDETWGYRSWQKRGSEAEKVKEKLASLIRVVSRGGNYLLNIGPRGDGSVVDFERNVLVTMGQWLQKNSEAIYGTQPDPFEVAFGWGSITSRKDRLYLHLLSDPENGAITLPGLKGKIRKVYGLADKTFVSFKSNDAGVTLQIPAQLAVKEEYKVIVLEFDGTYSVTPKNIITDQDGRIRLTHSNAFKYYSNSGIDYNTRIESTIKESWTVSAKQDKAYVPHVFYTAEEQGREIALSFAKNEMTLRLEDGEALPLNNDPSQVKWGARYVAGPLWSGPDGVHGKTDNIDVTKPWPRANDRPWKIMDEWKEGQIYTFPGEAMTAYYLLQELTSPTAQPLLIDIRSGEGVSVFVNGREYLTHLDGNKKEMQQHVILIQLTAGKNQVLVKFFNNFQKSVPAYTGASTEQVMYVKKLKPVTLGSNKLNQVSLKLYRPATPHQPMLLPNLRLEMIPE